MTVEKDILEQLHFNSIYTQLHHLKGIMANNYKQVSFLFMASLTIHADITCNLSFCAFVWERLAAK